PDGRLTVIYNCNTTYAADPGGGLIQGTDGNLYGTTSAGGNNGHSGVGTVFQKGLRGPLTTLHSFEVTDGYGPNGGLVQGTDGVFYGTTFGGGTGNSGTVFSLSMGLGPFVRTLPTVGKTGETIKILGTDLTGTTSVTFNGIPAGFTINSASFI